MILSGQKTQRILIAQLLMLHDEIDRRSALAARKAFANILGRRNIERRRFIGMKRTQTDEVHPALAQRDKLRHNIHNVCRFQNPLPCYRINHPPSFFSETKVKKLLDSFYFLLIEIFSGLFDNEIDSCRSHFYRLLNYFLRHFHSLTCVSILFINLHPVIQR